MAVIRWLQGVFENKKRASDERKLYKKIDEELVFARSEALTLGVEFELAVLDQRTLQPAHIAPEIIKEANSPAQIKPESFEHMVEVTSTIGGTARIIESQFQEQLDILAPICEKRGVLLTGTGWPPTVRLSEMKATPDKRYERLAHERKILGARFGTLGMHVHIGMENAEQCVRYHNFFMHFMPHLIALSASAPFENGIETGLASIRPSITESLPVAGMPYNFHNWQEYTNMCRAMYRAGSIQNLKDSWWDFRPSPKYGTLEVRICDMPASLSEAMAITAFIHGIAMWFREHQTWLDEVPRPNLWRLRENKWRAMRYGLNSEIVLNNHGETRPIREDIDLWIDRIMPFAEQCNYNGYIDLLESIMRRGNSAERQQLLWDNTHDLNAVAQFNCDEFMARGPLWERIEGYRNKKDEKPAKTKAS